MVWGVAYRRGNADEFQAAKIGVVFTMVPFLPSPQSPVLEKLNLDLLKPSERGVKRTINPPGRIWLLFYS